MKNHGNIIAELRREAGYTQKTLAEALNITDKAISKWERGLSLPDISLLPALSALLDADIELLLMGNTSGQNKAWAGLIDLRKFTTDLAIMVYDKPMVYYLLSHFLQLDVKEIYLLGAVENQSWIEWDELKQMGFTFHTNPHIMPKSNLAIMPQPCFLFGSDLTRRFQAAMSTEKIVKVCPVWNMTPFLFCPAEFSFMYYKNPLYVCENAVLKTLGRGIICLPLDTPDHINDVSSFVRIYQQNTGLKIQDLHEIFQLKA